MNKPFVALLLFLLFALIAAGNTSLNSTADSLQSLLKSGKLNQKQKIITLNELSREYLDSDPLKAQQIAMQALVLSMKGNLPHQTVIAYHSLGSALYNRQKLDSAKLVFEKAIPLATDIQDQEILGGIYQELGNIEADKGNYESGLNQYQQALRIFEKAFDKRKTAQTLSNIGALYINLGNYEKMYEYTIKALEMHRRNGYKMGIAACLTNLADYYFMKQDTAKIIRSLTEAQQLFHELKATINEANALGSIGDYYSEFFGMYDKAISYYQMSLGLLKPGDNNNLRMDGYRKISLAYYHKAAYSKALEYMQKAILITDTANIDYVRMNYNMLAYIYIGLKDNVKATDALDKYVELTDKVSSENQHKRIAEMEVKYQTEKKQQQILILEKEKQISRLYTFGLLVTLIVLLIISYLLYRGARSRSLIAKQQAEIQTQKISELEKERQLVATKSVLQGEEAERTRMARDLHDGLGGMLSGVKINLSSMKGNSIITSENAEAFDHALSLLDHSITELRRVAHNMMPETLMHYGLKVALEDFTSRIKPENTPEIDFRFFGEEGRFAPELEITIYRIAQELVNNAMKHSGADRIDIQLISEPNRLCIQVIDNGKGFDTSGHTGGGKGLETIRHRVEANNGKFEIWSKPGEGTEATIEFLVP